MIMMDSISSIPNPKSWFNKANRFGLRVREVASVVWTRAANFDFCEFHAYASVRDSRTCTLSSLCTHVPSVHVTSVSFVPLHRTLGNVPCDTCTDVDNSSHKKIWDNSSCTFLRNIHGDRDSNQKFGHRYFPDISFCTLHRIGYHRSLESTFYTLSFYTVIDYPLF